MVTAAVLLPPAYLLVRASESAALVDRLADESTLHALWRTVLLTSAVTVTAVALAVPLAWLTARTDLALRPALSVVLALPLAVPSFVGGFVMVSALGPVGLVRDLLEPLGVERLPSIYGFGGAWLVLSVLVYPYVFLPVHAALRNMDASAEEAARSLGKGPWATFLRVSLPLLRPAIAAGALLVALYTVSEFGAVSMLRYDTLTPLVYIEYTTSFDRASAAALGLPLIGLAVLLVAMDGMTRGRARYHTGSLRASARRMTLGIWGWPALVFCALVALAGIGIPVAVILYWLVKGLAAGGAAELLPEAVLNSAQVSALAAIAAALACLPVAMLAVRYPGWLGAVLEKASYGGKSLPAITIALALVFFASRYVTPLYQTIWVLVFAYAVRFLPEALGATRAALVRIDPNTEEAARGLGAGPLRTFRSVTLPQMLPGVLAGAALVFLTAIKELPITVLLAPIGFDTLATTIWQATNEAFFARAAAPSLALVALSALAVGVLQRETAVRD